MQLTVIWLALGFWEASRFYSVVKDITSENTPFSVISRNPAW
jgi:hypothetical protein